MLKYRREVDGLRAVAVLSVIFFHAGFSFFKGGYVGVDIFFVISGFLITNIILNELENNNFSIIDFYERRARRILPALFFIMAITIPFAWLILFPKDLESYLRSLSAIPMFKANHFFEGDVDYFATTSELKPLLHTWSLAVEEQYYIIFPILILLVGRKEKRRKLILITLAVLAAISLIRAHDLSTKKISENFFLLPTRFWEISIGSFIAFAPPSFLNFPFIKRQWMSCFGFLLILYSILTFSKDTPFPSFYALVPTLGTALVIMYAGDDTYIGRFLSTKFLVAIGLMSYSAYLWHHPVFAFSRYKLDPTYLNTNMMLLLSVISLVLAWLSWKFIETPFKNKARFNRSLVFKLSIAGSLLFILFGMSFSRVFHLYGLESLTAKLLEKNGIVFAQGISDERVFIRERIRAKISNPDVLIIGSSRIMQIKGGGKQRYLGLGVSGASVEDDLAIIYMADSKLNPKTILIAADPWLFNSKSNQERWKSIETEYLKATGKSQIEDTHNIKHGRLEWIKNRTKENIRKFYESTTFSLSTPINENRELKAKIRYDGFRIYDKNYFSKSQKEIEAEFNDLLNYSMAEFAPSKTAKQEFQKLINDQSKKRNVILVLTPYHPKLYARMKNEKPIFLEIENEYREFARDNDVSIIGSYDPNIVGCKIEEFHDGMHPKETCMAKIVHDLSE